MNIFEIIAANLKVLLHRLSFVHKINKSQDRAYIFFS